MSTPAHLLAPLLARLEGEDYLVKHREADLAEIRRGGGEPGRCWLAVAGPDGRLADDRAALGGGPIDRLLVVAPLDAWDELARQENVFDLLDPDAPAPRLALALRQAFRSIDQRRQLGERARQLLEAESIRGELLEVARRLSSERDIDKLLDLILLRSRRLVGADAGSIWIISDRREHGEEAPEGAPPAAAFSALGRDDDPSRVVLCFKFPQNDSVEVEADEFHVPVDEKSVVGYCALRALPVNIEDAYCLSDDVPYGFSPEVDRRLGYRTKSMLSVPMINHQDRVIGVIQLINRKRDPSRRLLTAEDVEELVLPFGRREVELVDSLASQAAVSLENARLYQEIQSLFDGFVQASVLAIESRDPTTSGHSNRVAALSLHLQGAVDRTASGPFGPVSFTARDYRVMRYASLLHDFGKVGVREEVLVKAKKLYPHELELVRARFHFLRRTLEMEYWKRRAEVLARQRPEEGAASLAELEREIEARRARLDAYWRIVCEANEPTVLEAEAFQQLHELGLVRFLDVDGSEQSLLRPHEIAALSIGRGSLTPEERREIESHVVHTLRFLERIPWSDELQTVPHIAFGHHEKMDGSGYPLGIQGPEIPLQTRMMTICDIFDALTARDRPYKRAVPVERALDILAMEVRSGQLDGGLFEIFLEAKTYEIVSKEGADLLAPPLLTVAPRQS